MELELILPLGGRQAAPDMDEPLGELTVEDVAQIAPGHRESRGTINALKRLTNRHQAIARQVALGQMTDTAIAAVFDISPNTLKDLRIDPAFRNLVDFYKQSEEEVFYSTQDRLRDLTHKAVEKLEEKLDDPEAFKKMSPGALLDIVTAGADRTGNGPTSTSVNFDVKAGLADRMKSAREAAARAMVNITPRAA